MSDYISEYRRLTTPLLIGEQSPGDPGVVGGQADLTPLKNKAREAVEALNDAQKFADSGRAEDTLDALRRARASIDAALGGSLGANSSAMAPMGGSGYGR